MRQVTFFGFLNDNGTVTHVSGKDEIVMPADTINWQDREPPKESDYPVKTTVVLERSALTGGRCSGDLMILGYYNGLFIMKDKDGLCYSMDWD